MHWIIFIGYFLVCYPVTNDIIVQNNNTSLISLDFQAIEINQALKTLGKFAGFNLVVEDHITGKVNLHLTNITSEEALESILKLQGLTQRIHGNTRIICANKRQLKKPTVSLESKNIVLEHRNAEEVRLLFLQKKLPKTPRSHLKADKITNSLWVTDTVERIHMLEQFVSLLDRPPKQVLIEARLVSINRNVDHSLGARFNLKPITQALPKQPETMVADVPLEETSSFLPLNFDWPSIAQSLHSIGPVLWAGFNRFLDLELAAIETEGHGQVIASPRLLTTDKTMALIEAGSEIPYQEKGRYGTSVAFKKAALSLQVTPEITTAGKVTLQLIVHHNKLGALSLSKVPTIDTQKIQTQVIVRDGETVALGGIYETVIQQTTYRVPGLSKIPWLGMMFTQKNSINVTRELLIFVTPHLITDDSSKKAN